MSDTATPDQVHRKQAIADKITRDKELRDRWVGIFIGVLACILALCTLVGNNTAKEAMRLHIEASNTWAFFQAKNLRRQMVRLKVDEVELELAKDQGLTPSLRDKLTKTLADLRTLDANLTSDKTRKEGLDELFVRGKQLEAERDTQFKKDPYFDWAQTFLQIAIVLASVCLVTGTVWLLFVAGTLGIAGTLLLINGHWLLVSIPWLA